MTIVEFELDTTSQESITELKTLLKPHHLNLVKLKEPSEKKKEPKEKKEKPKTVPIEKYEELLKENEELKKMLKHQKN